MLRQCRPGGGLEFGQVVKLGLYVTGISCLATLRRVRAEFIDVTKQPASTLLQVAGLFRPDVQVEAVAAVHA